MSYIYLASPYTHADPAVMQWRFEMAEYAAWDLKRRNLTTFSPIVHCHEMAKKYDLPKDYSFWRPHNMAMLKPARELVVLAIPGWMVSEGLDDEFQNAGNKPISCYTPPDSCPLWKLEPV